MNMHIRQHIGYYTAFALVQLLGLVLILRASGDRDLQMMLILGATLFYFLFAIVHHMLDHDLSAKVVIEYALMGCLGLAISLVVFNT
jgi:hypothetical protein